MRRAAMACLVLAAGCSGAGGGRSGAEYPRMATGSAAIVYEDTTVSRPDGREWTKDDPEFVERFLAPGDRLVVLDDKGDESDAARKVRARVESGKLAGRDYLVGRKAIRPAGG